MTYFVETLDNKPNLDYHLSERCPYIFWGTSKNRFEEGKWVECAECDESRRSKAVCLTRRFEEAVGVLYTFSLKQGF